MASQRRRDPEGDEGAPGSSRQWVVGEFAPTPWPGRPGLCRPWNGFRRLRRKIGISGRCAPAWPPTPAGSAPSEMARETAQPPWCHQCAEAAMSGTWHSLPSPWFSQRRLPAPSRAGTYTIIHPPVRLRRACRHLLALLVPRRRGRRRLCRTSPLLLLPPPAPAPDSDDEASSNTETRAQGRRLHPQHREEAASRRRYRRRSRTWRRSREEAKRKA